MSDYTQVAEADSRAETTAEVMDANFSAEIDGDSPDTPLPLKGTILGRNYIMAITIPRMEKRTAAGVIMPEEAQAKTSSGQIVKLCRDIPDWNQNKENNFRDLADLRDTYCWEYDDNAVILNGPIICWLPGCCELMPFGCPEPKLDDPKWGWLHPFWDKRLLKGTGGIEFVKLHFGSCLQMFKHYSFSRVDHEEETRAAMREISPHKIYTQDNGIVRTFPSIIVSGGLSPNRM